jgi:hypothetical protein
MKIDIGISINPCRTENCTLKPVLNQHLDSLNSCNVSDGAMPHEDKKRYSGGGRKTENDNYPLLDEIARGSSTASSTPVTGFSSFCAST